MCSMQYALYSSVSVMFTYGSPISISRNDSMRTDFPAGLIFIEFYKRVFDFSHPIIVFNYFFDCYSS